MTPGIPKYNESATIAASQPTSYRGLPLLATLDEPYTCSTIGPDKKRISIQISLEDEVNLIEDIYRTAKSNFSSPWIKRELKNTLCFHIQHRKMGRQELATQFCKDHGFDIDMLGDDNCIPLSIWSESIQIEIAKEKATNKHIKIFTRCYIPVAIIAIVVLFFNIIPKLDWLCGEHNNPDCPDIVYEAIHYVLIMAVMPMLYVVIFSLIWFLSIQIISSRPPLKQLAAALKTHPEWHIVPLVPVAAGALLVFLLWLFLTQFWAWVVFFGPPAILSAVFGKRRW